MKTRFVGSLMALCVLFMGCPMPHNPDITPVAITDDNGIVTLPAEKPGIELPIVKDGSASFSWVPGDNAQTKASRGVNLTPPVMSTQKGGGQTLDWLTIIDCESELVTEIELYFTELDNLVTYRVLAQWDGKAFVGSWRLPKGNYCLEIFFIRGYDWTTEIRDVLFYGRVENFSVYTNQTTEVNVKAALQNSMHALLAFVDFPEEDLWMAKGFWVTTEGGQCGYGGFHHDPELYGDVWLPWDFQSGIMETDTQVRSEVSFTWMDVVCADFVYVNFTPVDGTVVVDVDLTPPTIQ